MYLSNAYAGVRTGRRLRHLLIGGVVAALTIAAAPAVASADSPNTLTVVGTSDVSDSGLMQNLIQPGFQNAYPQYSLKYVGSATGAAIASAMGTGSTAGPSVLLVHAASLENQFVANGYSYQDSYGYAVFRNDFVLAGPNGDPAGVKTNGANNIAQAFADIAQSGVSNGKATFYTRGGSTTASGTTVEEHAIWQLMYTSNLTPAGVVLCDVSAADGGGMSPISPAVQSTSGQACPDSGTVSASDAPAWYYVDAGTTQAGNVEATNSCTAGYANNTCYTLTDRGTYDYLASDQLQLGYGTSLIPNLQMVTRDDSASAPGGADELVNYFHAYIINGAMPGESVNVPAAEDFIHYLTSPMFQAELANYLAANTGDTGGAPFVADASPDITEAGLPKTSVVGAPVTVTGTVTNAEIGYPALSGVTVNVDRIVNGVPLVVATTKTTTTGSYSVKFTPSATGSYEVSTPQITQVENASLSPVFGDILSPGSTSAVTVTLAGTPTAHAFTFKSVKTSGTTVSVSGTLSPDPAVQTGTVELLAGKGGVLKKVASYTLGSKHTIVIGSALPFTLKAKLAKGTYNLQLVYIAKGQTTTYSKLRTVSVK